MVQETEKLLEIRGLSKLTTQQQDMLKRQTEGIASPDNTVLNLISEYNKTRQDDLLTRLSFIGHVEF